MGKKGKFKLVKFYKQFCRLLILIYDLKIRENKKKTELNNIKTKLILLIG